MSGRRDRRDTRRSAEKRKRTEINSLADSSTPVDSRPKKTSNPKKAIQERVLPTVPENIIIANAARTSEHSIYDNSNKDSGDSVISDLEGKKLIPTTIKKKDQSNLPIIANISFNLTMAAFDTEMTYMVIHGWGQVVKIMKFD